MFCPKCGSLMVPKTDKGKKIMLCPKCKATDKEAAKNRIVESIESKEKEIEVVEKNDALETLPKIDIECPKCSNKKARFWTVQTRASDEPETKFFKCTKCMHTWRDYS